MTIPSVNVEVHEANAGRSDEIWRWLNSNLGPHRMLLPPDKWRWWTGYSSGSPPNHRIYCFTRPQDAMLFKLAWGGSAE